MTGGGELMDNSELLGVALESSCMRDRLFQEVIARYLQQCHADSYLSEGMSHVGIASPDSPYYGLYLALLEISKDLGIEFFRQAGVQSVLFPQLTALCPVSSRDPLSFKTFDDKTYRCEKKTFIGALLKLTQPLPLTCQKAIERELESSTHGLIQKVMEKMSAAYQGLLTNVACRENLPDSLTSLTVVELSSLSKRLAESKSDERYLASVMKDYCHLKQLTGHVFTINTIDEEGVEYVELDEVIGGVTKKIGLCELKSLREQLAEIDTKDVVSLKVAYQMNGSLLAIGCQAMFKYPKKDDIKELLREALALNLSRTLGLETTRFQVVEVQGKPSLFIPFDKITLLSQLASGEIKKADFGFSGKEYQEHSLMNPLAEGIFPEHVTDDFGKAFALFFLCNDPDFIGGELQNKAMLNNGLYVFDLLFKESTYLQADADFHLNPNGALAALSRHTCGRNRLLINDSDHTTKLRSVRRVLQLHKRGFFSQIFAKARDDIQQGYIATEVDVLMGCMDKLEATLGKRIEQLKLLASPVELDKGLAAFNSKRKLFLYAINAGCWYNDDGKPYRYPFVEKSVVSSERFGLESNDNVVLYLDGLTEERRVFIRRRCKAAGITCELNDNTIRMKKAELETFELEEFYPEFNQAVSLRARYLVEADWVYFQKQYAASEHHQQMLDIMKGFCQDRTTADVPVRVKLTIDNIVAIDELIKRYGLDGFSAHLRRQLLLDTLQFILLSQKTNYPELTQVVTQVIQYDCALLFCHLFLYAMFNQQEKSQHVSELLGVFSILPVSLEQEQARDTSSLMMELIIEAGNKIKADLEAKPHSSVKLTKALTVPSPGKDVGIHEKRRCVDASKTFEQPTTVKDERDDVALVMNLKAM